MAVNQNLGDMNANSYVSASQANAYFSNRNTTDSWDALATAAKGVVLIQAARDINRFNFIGEKYYDNQSMEFPRDDHFVVTGICATPTTLNSFKHTNLYSTTYNKYPANYWQEGTVHITAGTPVRDIRRISLSNVTTGSITVATNFTATPSTTAQFIAFAPIDIEIQEAQYEQALYILNNANIDTLQTYKELSARRVRIGDTEVELFMGGSTRIAISPASRKLLSRWIRKSVRIGRG